ncbi:hypothetical protein [Saccharopolyspora phatthalungensis]|uniref:Uncharacterized protein n=1 Tax=Saccharopolyspora phatthalungensis TaxID=664693 RepID=A0A840QG95_9PSEU|nr:hypothetical protein [Saccharopolyspora phatthalungensis]MBB5157629.1 hypothetical protein [Saccharopolyspora phatthalungensis]
MHTPLQDKPSRNRFARIRRYFAIQNSLWSRQLAALQPWDQDAELHWVRNPVTRRWELRGGVLPES